MTSIINLRRPLLQVLAPPAPARFTSWADAVIAVGCFLHGDSWNAAESAKPTYEQGDYDALIWSRVAKEHPDLARRRLESKKWGNVRKAQGFRSSDSQPSERDSQLLKEIADAREALAPTLPPFEECKAENEKRKAMLFAAKDRLANSIMNDELKAYWLSKGSPTLPVEMLTGPFMAALADGGYQLKVMGMITHDRRQRHIYVDTAGLAKLYPPVSTADEEADALGMPHLSPYLRLMLHIARLKEVTPSNQPKVDELEALFRERAATFGLTFSDTSLYPINMARMIREPRQ